MRVGEEGRGGAVEATGSLRRDAAALATFRRWGRSRPRASGRSRPRRRGQPPRAVLAHAKHLYGVWPTGERCRPVAGPLPESPDRWPAGWATAL
jgi:hypothetical protein